MSAITIFNKYISKSALVVCFSALAFSLQASEISEGVVVEGESLPIGVSLNDTRAQIDATISSIPEFSEISCRGLNQSSCVYTAYGNAGEELGSVTVFFSRGSGNPDDSVSSIRYDFPNWITTSGLSLDGLQDLETEEELEVLYPDASRTLVFSRGDTTKVVILRSPADGILMVSSKRRGRLGFYGIISKPR